MWRSCLAMMLCGETSFDVWVKQMRDEPFYALISGFDPADVPGVGTFYDFQDRLLGRPRQPRTRKQTPHYQREQQDWRTEQKDKNNVQPHQNIINRLAERILARPQAPQAFHRLYPEVQPSDIPFAQDQVGDQFLWRSGGIYRLPAETGQVELFCAGLPDFLRGLQGDVEQFFTVGLSHQLQPGELLHAYPPFCVRESGAGASLRACPASEVVLFHAEFARQIRDIPDRGKIEIKITD